MTSSRSSARLSRSLVSDVTASALSRIRPTTSSVISGLAAGGMAMSLGGSGRYLRDERSGTDEEHCPVCQPNHQDSLAIGPGTNFAPQNRVIPHRRGSCRRRRGSRRPNDRVERHAVCRSRVASALLILRGTTSCRGFQTRTRAMATTLSSAAIADGMPQETAAPGRSSCLHRQSLERSAARLLERLARGSWPPPTTWRESRARSHLERRRQRLPTRPATTPAPARSSPTLETSFLATGRSSSPSCPPRAHWRA